MHASPKQEGLELYLKTLSWARLNFELQSMLLQPTITISTEIKEKLCEIGYVSELLHSLCPQEKERLFKAEAFFSPSKTGNRIVTFALKENGLNREKFQYIEESITNAYMDVKRLYGQNAVLDMSYKHSLEGLAVFRL